MSFIKEVLVELHRVLKEEGSIFFHCDFRMSHWIRVLLEEVFSNFRSEVVWTYKKWSNSKKGLQNNHQTIFWYSKSKNFCFNQIYTEYSKNTNIKNNSQKRCRIDGKVVYKRDNDGNIIPNGEKKGVPLSDVWEIPLLNPVAKERVGYPTQKPLELLNRILKLSSNEGDIILDPFCGSGTSLVSAKLNERNFVGIDISQDALEISRRRIKEI